MRTLYAVLGFAAPTAFVLVMIGYIGNSTPVLAIPFPPCNNCSIHGDGTGTMTAPDPSQVFLCHCAGCHANISFDASQIDKKSVSGKLTLVVDTDDAGPHTILGDINAGKITEKQFVLKGVITDTENPDGIGMHFTINGQVGKGTINYSEDDGMTGTFTGTVLVTTTT